MDLFNDPNRVRTLTRLSSTEERFFGVPPHAPSLENPTPIELIEDDVVFSSYDYSEQSSSSSPNHHNHNHHHHHHHKGSPYGPPDSFGILAALPEKDASPNSRNGSPFVRKAQVSVSLSASLSSSSSSSSSRAILAIPRRPSMPTLRFPQSAPVDVPMMSPAMLRAVKKFEQEEAEKMAEEEFEEMVMPPHELVAKKSAQSGVPMLSCSVMEGVGRTLKGRDMRQVRNAVLRETASDFRLGNCKSIKTLLNEYEIEELINNGSVFFDR